MASHRSLLDMTYKFIVRQGFAEPDAKEIHNDMLKGFVRFAERENWELAPSSFRPLMFDIAKKLIVDRRRAASRRRSVPVDYLELEVLVVRSTRPIAVDETARRLDVRRAIAQLKADQRTALELRYFYGFTINQVAEHMNLSRTAVKKHISNALARLGCSGSLTGYEPCSTTARTNQAEAPEAQA